MATNATVERILDGTIRALARRGHRKLSMSDICECAGVSRGTLYRYFSSKEEVLGALSQHVREGVRDRLAAAIAEEPRPEHRLRTVVSVVIETQWSNPESTRILEVEPGFALDFVRGVFPEFVEIVADALKPAADHIPALRDKALTPRQLAELALRVGASAVFIPASDAKDLPRRLERLAGIDVPETHQAKRPRRSATTQARKAG